MSAQYQRSRIMIKNDFQHSLILSTLLITLISLNFIIIVAGLLDTKFGDQFALFDLFRVSIAVMEVVAVIIVFYVSRKISFHIAGPVYAIERTLKQMREGDLVLRLTLRKGDQFPETADVLNEVLENYQSRIAAVKSVLAANPGMTSEQCQNLLEEHLDWFVTEREE